MAEFAYRIMTPAGKEKKGTIQAKSRDAAMQMLKANKNVVIMCEDAAGLHRDLILAVSERRLRREILLSFAISSKVSTQRVCLL